MLCKGKQGYGERKRHDHIDEIVERQRAKQCASEERRHNYAEPAAPRGGDPPQGDHPTGVQRWYAVADSGECVHRLDIRRLQPGLGSGEDARHGGRASHGREDLITREANHAN